MNQKKTTTSFTKWVTRVNLLSVFLAGTILAIITVILISVRLNADYREIATTTSVNVAHTLDCLSDEDYTYDEETNTLKKGDIEITDKAFQKSLEFNANVHHTIFWGDTRVLTDVKDLDGKSVVGSKLTDETITKAIAEDGIYTDNGVNIYGSKYTVCYYPIKNGEDIVGYVFTGVNQGESTKHLLSAILIAILTTTIVASGVGSFVIGKLRAKAKEFDEQLTTVSDIANEKRQVVTELGHETSDNMDQINVAVGQMAQAVTQQASHTEEVMATMGDFGNNLDGIINEVGKTSQITMDSQTLMDELETELIALEQASKENSNEIVNIGKQIEEDNQAVESISHIVKVINDIAFQITILSFNASVEAAHAGEAGMGFAVVADSIKDLSDKTQESVNEIAEIIDSITEKMAQTAESSENLMGKNENVIKALATTKDRLGSVTEAFAKIAQNVESVQNDSAYILVAKNQVLETMSSFAATSEENAAMAEEISSTSNIVIEATDGLLNEIESLRVITDTIDVVKKQFA